MQDLIIEMQQLRDTLTLAINKLRERGQDKATAEKNYRVALAKEILKQRAEGLPVTVISDICRGKEEIAELKMKRDIAESMYESAMQKIFQCKLEIGIVQNQLNAERKGE